MFKRWILGILFVVPLWGWADISSEQTQKNELVLIEQKIQALKEQLHQERLIEMKEEVKGQEYMIADWDAYSQELLKIRQLEEQDHQIEQQVKKLEQLKVQLLTKQQQPQ